MRKFHFETNSGQYTVTLKQTDKRAKTGQILTAYQLIAPDGAILFAGDDLGCSPMHSPESYDNAIALLGFLTCQPGDVDEDYFKDYTSAQLAWVNSDDCEWLSSVVYDYETQE